jgi:hypothetical protein
MGSWRGQSAGKRGLEKRTLTLGHQLSAGATGSRKMGMASLGRLPPKDRQWAAQRSAVAENQQSEPGPGQPYERSEDRQPGSSDFVPRPTWDSGPFRKGNSMLQRKVFSQQRSGGQTGETVGTTGSRESKAIFRSSAKIMLFELHFQGFPAFLFVLFLFNISPDFFF